MTFDPATDIPDLGGKVIFITGGTAGLGKQSILALVKKNPAHVYFSGRDAPRAAALISEITAAIPSAQLTFVECNMSSLASVAKAAKQVTSKTDQLDIMMCNAGVWTVPPALTEDGYETQFGINHLSHALLLKLLRPILLRTPDARVSGFPASEMRYPQSKLANLIYAAELARRYPQLTSVSVHPGIVATDMVLNAPWTMKLFLKVIQMWTGEAIVKPETGALNQVWAATAAKTELVNGEYYVPVGKPGKHTKLSADKKLAEKLWEWTEKELEGYYLS
ncbi:hypothetical protein B0H17DRAFT_1165213 [Mycena rosella]|uniref:Oxidoreductase n=1 Tax=Mycena rosella TaxID=1033263 RepID=A0AAD7AY10_MYCRO|nr:hypothetical protein B0H17DRAFT_1165213 [Mycena rosella]